MTVFSSFIAGDLFQQGSFRLDVEGMLIILDFLLRRISNVLVTTDIVRMTVVFLLISLDVVISFGFRFKVDLFPS